MKKLMLLTATIFGAFALTACQPTSNSSDNGSSSSNVALTCTTNQYGQYVDQYGRSCNTTGTNNCSTLGYVYNPATGQWQNQAGQVVSCNPGGVYTGGTTPPVGGGTTVGTNCAYWSTVYPGTTYVPMSIGGGQLVCVNLAALVPNYTHYYSDWSYSQPIYGVTCPYDYYTCTYGQNGGGTWDDGGSTCLGVGYDDGSDYGIGGFFGICF